MIKIWNDATLHQVQVSSDRRKGPGASTLTALIASLRGSRASVTPVPERHEAPVGGLRERLAEHKSRQPRYATSRGWGDGWSPRALEALRGRAGGGAPRLPESEDCPYELRVLLRPGHPEGGGESRWYRSDLVALRAFTTARSLLADPNLGLGLALLRDGCLVYEWTEVPGTEWRDLSVAPHRRRGCAGHASLDTFDALARVYDQYCALGYREGGTCSRVCVDSCPGVHGDLLAAMMRAEAAALGISAEDGSPVPGGQEP